MKRRDRRPAHRFSARCAVGRALRVAAAAAASGLWFAPATLAQAPTPASRDNAFTVYAGWRDGGSFTDALTARRVRLDGSGAFSASFDQALDGARQLQLFVSRQSTTLRVADTAAAAADGAVPLKVTYLHLGGTNFFSGPVGSGPYVVGGIGATMLQPGLPGLTDELRPSLNVGLGWQLPLGKRLALRLEARGYFTLIDSRGGLFCSGGCVLTLKGDGFSQGDAMLGLQARF